jgi:hypothetical protein
MSLGQLFLKRGWCRFGHQIKSIDDLFVLNEKRRKTARCLLCYRGELQQRKDARAIAQKIQPRNRTLIEMGVCRKGLHPIHDISDTRNASNGYRQCRRCYDNSQVTLRNRRPEDRTEKEKLQLIVLGHCKNNHPIKSYDDIYINPSTGWGHCRECRYQNNKRYALNRPPTPVRPGIVDVGFCRKRRHRIDGPQDLTKKGSCRKCRVFTSRRARGVDVNLPWPWEKETRGGWQRRIGPKPKPAKKEKVKSDHIGTLKRITLHCSHTLDFKEAIPSAGEMLYCTRCRDYGEVL